jgi:hypothetical protein
LQPTGKAVIMIVEHLWFLYLLLTKSGRKAKIGITRYPKSKTAKEERPQTNDNPFPLKFATQIAVEDKAKCQCC